MIDDFDGAALELAARAGVPVGVLGRGAEHPLQALAGQAFAALAISAGVFIDGPASQQAKEGLDVADHLAAGAAGVKGLPEETLHRQAEVEDAVAAVEALVFLGQKIGRQDVVQEGFQLGQGGLADLLGGALAAGGQLGAPGGEKRRLHVQ